ncbi:hypothetical protein M2G33_09275 [Vibrio vulnificus]|nr:hypothetical protein [Vibrio vulnificus]MCU8530036.1 hypothetical protein [Vibrio vulnificus]
MSLKKQLPTGSPRNKIEFLADFVEQQIAEISQGAKGAPQNLLPNPDFSTTELDFATLSPFYTRWATGAFTYTNQSKEQMHLGRSFGRPAPAGWGVEVMTESSDFHSAFYNTIGGEVEKRDATAKASFFMMGGNSSKILHFSVFSAPMENEILVGEGATPVKKDLSFSAYLRCHDDITDYRFGILELNSKGDFVAYVASGFANRAQGANFSHTWLHGIKLKPGGLYAYFIESNMQATNGKSCAPTGCGVFLNPERLNVIPDLNPNAHTKSKKRAFESFGNLSKAELNDGVSVDVGRFVMPFGMEKHLIFCNCQTIQTGTEAPYSAATITQSDYKTIHVQGDTTSTQTHGHLMAYYSEMPVHLNYFKSNSYTAS